MERFLIKWQGRSYLHVSWETFDNLLSQSGQQIKGQVRRFIDKMEPDKKLLSEQLRGDGEYFHPDSVTVERVLRAEGPGLKREDVKNFTCDDPSSPLPSSTKPPKMVFDRDHDDYEENESKGREFLIKWSSTPYSEISWEYERDLINGKVQYEMPTELFFRRNRKPTEKWFKRKVRVRALVVNV